MLMSAWKTQHDLLDEWLLKRSEYMTILLEKEALPLGLWSCKCNSGYEARYVCTSCHGGTSYCQMCTVALHRKTPFHKIKRWNDAFLEDVTLSELGLVTYLNHHGTPCPTASSILPLTAIHLNGIHAILISYCQCQGSPTVDLQLFGSNLFPASTFCLKTTFTFKVLQNFRHHHLQGKISAYTYVQSLYRLTGDENLTETPVCIRVYQSSNVS